MRSSIESSPAFDLLSIDFGPDHIVTHRIVQLRVDEHVDTAWAYLQVLCKLQYKCRILFEFSIENAEMMENCP